MSTAPSMDPSDDALFSSIRDRRDERALEVLIARHWRRVYGLAYRLVRDPALAEDVAQETFVKLARGVRYEAGSFAGFLARIAVNEARDALRRERRRARHEEAAGARRQRGPERPDDLAVLADAHLAALPEELRSALVLRYQEGLTHEEVATALGVPAGTASSRLRRGLERLRESLATASCVVALPEIESLLARPPAPPPAPAAPSAAHLLARAGRAVKAGVAKMLATAAIVLTVGLAALSLLGPRVGIWDRTARAPATPASPASQAAGANAPATPAAPASDAPGRTASGAGAETRDGAAPPSTPPAAPAAAANPAAAEGVALAISGQVLSPDGGALEGARVVVALSRGGATSYRYAYDLLATSEVREQTKQTDPSGAFRIIPQETDLVYPDGTVADWEGGRYTHAAIVIQHDAAEPFARPLVLDELTGKSPLIVRMRAGGAAIRGRVIDSVTRKGLPLLMVGVRQPAGLAPACGAVEFVADARTAHDGGFEARGLRRGPALVMISTSLAGPLGAAECRTLMATPGESEPVEIEVTPAARLKVEARDEKGRRLSRFHAILEGAQGGRVSDRLPDVNIGYVHGFEVPAGTYTLRVGLEKDGPHPATATVTLIPGREREISVVIPGAGAEEIEPPPELAPEAGSAPEPPPGMVKLAGTVVDADGNPVDGAKVSFLAIAYAVGGRRQEAPFEQHEATTRADGRFELDAPPSGAFVGWLSATARGFAERRVSFDPDAAHREPGVTYVPEEGVETIEGGSRIDALVVRLERAARIVARIYPPEGTSIADLARALEAALYTARGRTDEPSVEIAGSGIEVSFETAPGARGTLLIYRKGGAAALFPDLVAGATPREIAFPTGPGLTLRGRVVRPDGAAAAGVRVMADVRMDEEPSFLDVRGVWSAKADAEGRFELPHLPAGPLVLSIWQGDSPREVHAADTREALDLGEIRLAAPGPEGR